MKAMDEQMDAMGTAATEKDKVEGIVVVEEEAKINTAVVNTLLVHAGW